MICYNYFGDKMKKIVIEDKEYELIENYKDGYDEESLKEKYTDYFYDYDYILGDWAYGKLRLKGFNEKTNPNFNKINDINNKKNYLENECAYECKYFFIKKIK